ncbi:MAG: LemA family protein [Oscillospiraceae bacterium]|nr:LemA family protein [Oscillospiraceae bacterium]
MEIGSIITIAVIALLVIIIVSFFISTYNGLIANRNRVRNQKSQIDVELKRRFDLVPNLVETVKGYANHEKTALEDVIKARSNYVTVSGDTAQALAADNALTGALSKLFALSESYPELKANTNFMSLQKELSEIEKRIVFARQFYNDSVLKFNNKIEMFPSNIVAGMFKFTTEPFFEAAESERQNVTVSF